MEKVVMKASRTDSGYCCACDLIPGWVVAYTGGIDGFKDYIYRLNFDESFKKAHIHIHKDEISEVDSSKHIMLQFMDLILGAVCFRLNNKHKIKDQATGRRGKRTILKEKLYKHINSRIRDIYPNFNIGISTGCNDLSDRWTHPYRHWAFIPTSNIRDVSQSKGHKK